MAGAKSMTLAALAAAATLAPAGVAEAAAREVVYDVTFEVQGKRTWTFTQTADRDCLSGRCVYAETATGTETLQLGTPHPQRVRVLLGGKQPAFFGDTESDLHLKGSHAIDGVHTTTYSGEPEWDANNPDQADATTGCGKRTVKQDVAFGWKGRHRLALVAAPRPLRQDCPNGLPIPADGLNGAARPELGDVVADAAEAKFRGTKQLTIRGRASWQGTVPTIERTDPMDLFHQAGQEEVSWQWRATFRKVKPKKRGRR